MANHDTDYRDPKVTTTNDSSGGMPSWLKWVLIAIAVIAVLWLLSALFMPDNDAARVGTTDPDAVILDQQEGDETVTVVPTD
jgi:hypothetical protein